MLLRGEGLLAHRGPIVGGRLPQGLADLSELVGEIDGGRQQGNLSSAIRLFVLDYFRPTADHRILPGGTAYMTDVGMCGAYDGVIGMDKEEPLRRFTRKIGSSRFEPASGPGTLSGLAVEIDTGGHATRIAPVRIGGLLEPAVPPFW